MMACKDKGNTAEVDKRCEQLAKTCGDKDKHTEKILEECKQAAAKHAEKNCSGRATALFDCYEKELCGKADKVWALEDLRVLADRKDKCTAERDASRECVGK